MEPQNTESVKLPSEHVKVMAIIHLVGMFLGAWGAIGALVYWLIYRDKFAPSDTATFYEILNFNISFMIYALISGVLCLVLIGFVFLFILAILYFIFVIISTIKFMDGQDYKFPMTIRIIK
jgi:uncharacterized Tic20 family protein